jgi:Protein of unknown function (DUF3103)
MRRVISIAAAAACALLIPVVPTPAHAGEKGVIVQEEKEEIRAALRATVASDPASMQALLSRLPGNGPAYLTELLAGVASQAARKFTRDAEEADLDIKRGKGIEHVTQPLLQARWVQPDNKPNDTPHNKPNDKPNATVTTPLFAATPRSDAATTLTAFDIHGKPQELGLSELPAQPIVLVELNLSGVLPAAAQAVESKLAADGVDAVAPKPLDRRVTRLEQIRVVDDKEPWIAGAAETYAVVIGRGKTNTMRVDFVDMSYLDRENTTFSPRQPIVNWRNYGWQRVDVVILEQDDSTDCDDLVGAIRSAVARHSQQAEYVSTIDDVLQALRNKSASVDDDYVDAFAGLSWGAPEEDRNGVERNAHAKIGSVMLSH